MAKSGSYFDWELGFRDERSNLQKDQIDVYIKQYVGKKTLYQAAKISEHEMEINMELQGGIFTCYINYALNPLAITIDTNKWEIAHDCLELRAINQLSLHKQFCSHLTKLFLLLREKNPRMALTLLEHISTHDYHIGVY